MIAVAVLIAALVAPWWLIARALNGTWLPTGGRSDRAPFPPPSDN